MPPLRNGDRFVIVEYLLASSSVSLVALLGVPSGLEFLVSGFCESNCECIVQPALTSSCKDMTPQLHYEIWEYC